MKIKISAKKTKKETKLYVIEDQIFWDLSYVYNRDACTCQSVYESMKHKNWFTHLRYIKYTAAICNYFLGLRFDKKILDHLESIWNRQLLWNSMVLILNIFIIETKTNTKHGFLPTYRRIDLLVQGRWGQIQKKKKIPLKKSLKDRWSKVPTTMGLDINSKFHTVVVVRTR